MRVTVVGNDRGQDTVEMALVASAISIAAFVVLQAMAPLLTRLYMVVRFTLMERGVGWW